MSRKQIAPGVWQDEAPSSALIRHPESTVPAETIGSMRPLMKSGVYLENRSRTKPPQAFSIHPEHRRTPVEYPPSVMTRARTNPDNGAVKAPITEVRS